MSTLTKVFIVLTSVLVITLSCLVVSAAVQWDNYRALAEQYKTERDAQIAHTQNSVASMYAALALKDETIAAKTRDLATAMDESQRLGGELEASQRRLAEVDNERVAFDADRKKVQDMLDVTMERLQAAAKAKDDLFRENLALQSRNNELNSRVLDLTTNVAILTDEARNLQEKLVACEKLSRGPAAAPRVAAAPAEGPMLASAVPPIGPEIRGRIVNVSDGYASIDVGESSGVGSGMVFMVYRAGGKFVGEISIESVRPKEAGGRLTMNLDNVRTGDFVVNSVE